MWSLLKGCLFFNQFCSFSPHSFAEVEKTLHVSAHKTSFTLNVVIFAFIMYCILHSLCDTGAWWCTLILLISYCMPGMQYHHVKQIIRCLIWFLVTWEPVTPHRYQWPGPGSRLQDNFGYAMLNAWQCKSIWCTHSLPCYNTGRNGTRKERHNC